MIKNYSQHRIYFIAWFSPTYENPLGFSIRYLFTKISAEIRNKAYSNTLPKIIENKKK